MKINTDRLALALFIFSILILVYGFGIITHKHNLFPYSMVRNAISTLLQQGEAKYSYLVPIRHDQSGPQIHDKSAMSPGVTLITSYWPDSDWTAGIRIINTDGEILHHWNLNPTDIWPESPYTDSIAGTKNIRSNYIHGSFLFPNGDVLVNIEYLGLVRLNACSQIIWKLPYRTHHSITQDAEGNFWVSGMKWIDTDDTNRFSGLVLPYAEDTVIKVSPDGKIIKEVSILDAIYQGNHQYLLWKHKTRSGDITHINDVEVLDNRQAADHPLFNTGDLLISLKHISTIAVLDQSGHIKWLNAQNFNRQHDADFESDGWITVFDNREDTTDTGDYLGGSIISAINPANGKLKFIYPEDGSKKFFTNAGGKHQLLENGNRLITETRGARIFEITPSGSIIWEWIQQPYNDEVVAEVMEGTRYNIANDIISKWQCNKKLSDI